MDKKSLKVLGLAIALGALGMSTHSAVADEGRFYQKMNGVIQSVWGTACQTTWPWS